MPRYTVPLRDALDLELVGGKATPLARLIRAGYNVPEGLVVTTKAYDYYTGNGALPDGLEEELESRINRFPVIARSSATIEDTLYHSFAGQFLSVFPINSMGELLRAIERIYRSARSRKLEKYLSLLDERLKIRMAVIVQEFINTIYGGVCFSRNIFENRDEVVVEISPGLAENVVSGKAESNIYFVDRESFRVRRRVERFSLDELVVKDVAEQAVRIEELFGFPVDVEFGVKGGIYIFQARPITPRRRRESMFKVPGGWTYIEGIPTGTGKAFGVARIVRDRKDLKRLKPGEILVSKTTYNDWMPDMLKAAGIVNELGNITSHSAIVAREFGIPAVVNARGILGLVRDGVPLFVDADSGRVYYPGGETVKLLDFLSDFTLDLTPLDIDSLERVGLKDVVRDPTGIVLFEEYLGRRIVYFHHSVHGKTRRSVAERLSAVEGHTDVHWNYVEWAYAFLVHSGLREWVDAGKKLLDDPKSLDRYLYETMKLARRSIDRAYRTYREAKEEGDIGKYIRVLDLIDLSSKYFGIANTLMPLGYGIRKLRELAMQYGDYRTVLSKVEEYRGTKMYNLYKVLEKWKNFSDKMDVWDARTQLWNAVRRRLREKYGFDPNDYIENGTGYKLDLYIWERFGIKREYL